MESIGRHASSDHFGIDPGTPVHGMPVFLKDQRPGSIGHHKTVAVLIKRTGSRGRIIIPGRNRTHGVETGKGRLVDTRFGSAGDHEITLPHPDYVKRLKNRMGCRSTCSHRGEVRPPETIFNGQQPPRNVGDHFGNKKRRELRPFMFKHPYFLKKGLQTPDTCSPNDPGPVFVDLVQVNTRIFHRPCG